ncbi:MAG: ABC transporter permease [Roseitalea sp.]|uniref:ABC transporter permease n=1 Tax=Oceaniradius stylonematis TaxID=2184161 RepID=A0A3A8A6R0_9HYPH|nr:ABC transporter permease [Oceaniradius stylonematis]MBO6551711.1 ABC transporter permease [Roseitalea sp.]MBO6951909.1 ABC transporter permease [Rhizobiaceae bacterium]MBO6592245.1 ABC transporter permease [Roseitalea sp.]MBO6598500.1 ABC transporter permease [Roseitalea sp.]MBO6610946.1 ABC transporter permease [Roseitalea sp.]
MSASALADEPGFLEALFARRAVLVSLIVFLVILAAVILAPLIAPADPSAMSVRNRLAAPGGDYWLGADAFGRDVLSRLLYAGQVSLTIGCGVALVASVVGIVFGLVAGFFRRLDGPVSRIVDAMMAFPDILLAIALVAILGGSMINVIIALSIVYAPRIARIVRASTLVIRELPFVEAAQALGSSTGFIMINHVLRNIVSPIIVQATFIFAYAMLAEAGLSFLGVGVDPSTPTWGTMINEGRQYIDQAAFLIFFPGIAISVSVLCLQLIGDGLRDALDPRIAKEL